MTKPHVRIVETEAFSRDAETLLSQAELDAIRSLLVSDPLYGEPYHQRLRDKLLLKIDWRRSEDIEILYLVGISDGELEIILVAIHQGHDKPGKIDIDKTGERLEKLHELGFFAIKEFVSESIRKIIESVF